MGSRHSDRWVRLIGGLKLVKATLLLALGAGGLTASASQLSELAGRVVVWIGIFPGRSAVTHALQRLLSLDLRTEHRLAALSLAYATVFLVEGVGLLRRNVWAEWLTVVVTTSFVPFEIYELTQGFAATKLAALVLNVVIVAYLLWRRVKERRDLTSRLRHALRLA